jgi:hypothetical protein
MSCSQRGSRKRPRSSAGLIGAWTWKRRATLGWRANALLSSSSPLPYKPQSSKAQVLSTL